MKWFIRIMGAILLIFVGLCVGGFFMPAVQTTERTIEIEAVAEDVFHYLTDLREYPRWSVIHANNPDMQIAYGGSEYGVGQTAAWQIQTPRPSTGTQEIIESRPPEFVRTIVNIDGLEGAATFAISESENEDKVSVLMRQEINLGGFPFVQRLTHQLSKSSLNSDFDAALARLKTVVEAELDLEDQ